VTTAVRIQPHRLIVGGSRASQSSGLVLLCFGFLLQKGLTASGWRARDQPESM